MVLLLLESLMFAIPEESRAHFIRQVPLSGQCKWPHFSNTLGTRRKRLNIGGLRWNRSGRSGVCKRLLDSMSLKPHNRASLTCLWLPCALGHEIDQRSNRYVRTLFSGSQFRRTAQVRHKAEDGRAALPDLADPAGTSGGNGDPGTTAREIVGQRHVC